MRLGFGELQKLSTTQRLLLATALLVAVVPRALAAAWQFYNMDEATTAIVAKTILEGGIPYRDIADQRGPVTYSLYALVFRTAGIYNMTAVHLAHAVLLAVLTLLVFRVGALQGRQTGVLAATFFAATSYSSPATDLLAFHIEWPLILCTLIGVLLLWRGLAADRIVWMVIAGAALALAALSKQPALSDFGLLTAWAVLVHARGIDAPRRGLQAATALLGGFAAVAVTYLGSLTFAGALGDFVFNYWTYNTRYFLPVIPVSQRIHGALTLDTRYPGRHIPLLLLCAAGLLRSLRTWRREGRPWTGRALLPYTPYVWLLSSYVGAMWSGRASGHYFIQLLPAACWIGGDTLARILTYTRTMIATRHHGHLLGPTVAVLLSLVLWAPMTAPNSAARHLVYRLVTQAKASADRTVRGAEKVAAWLRAQPDPGSIFVWGFMPEIYVLADRPPSSRFILCTGLSGMIPWVDAHAIDEASWRTFQTEMESHPPRYVIDTSPGEFRAYGALPPEGAPPLWRLLEQRYRLATTIYTGGKPGFRIFERTAATPF